MRQYRLLFLLLTIAVFIVSVAAATTYEKSTSEEGTAITDGPEGVASGDSASKVATTTKTERGWGLAVVRVGVAVGKAVARAAAVVAAVLVKTVVHMVFPGP